MCMKFGKEKWLSSLTLEEAGKILDISKLIGWWVFGLGYNGLRVSEVAE